MRLLVYLQNNLSFWETAARPTPPLSQNFALIKWEASLNIGFSQERGRCAVSDDSEFLES